MSADAIASYATLILADADIEITSDKLQAIAKAANAELEPVWAETFAKATEGKDLKKSSSPSVLLAPLLLLLLLLLAVRLLPLLRPRHPKRKRRSPTKIWVWAFSTKLSIALLKYLVPMEYL